jgi:hypothetical protein
MSFGMRIEPRASDRRRRSSRETVGPLAAIAIVFALFCIYDYSPYGHGFVESALGDSQRWFQRFVASFKIKM